MRIITKLNDLITKNFKRRYYYDKNTNEYFFFTNLFLGLPKRKHFDLFVCAKICDQSTTESYSKTSKIILNKIGKRTSNNINLNRATVRNIVLPLIQNMKKLVNLKESRNYLLCLPKIYRFSN